MRLNAIIRRQKKSVFKLEFNFLEFKSVNKV